MTSCARPLTASRRTEGSNNDRDDGGADGFCGGSGDNVDDSAGVETFFGEMGCEFGTGCAEADVETCGADPEPDGRIAAPDGRISGVGSRGTRTGAEAGGEDDSPRGEGS